ncbi:hypothetical protein K470DRAFT_256586 [Piedraia hortae CBS 480.64]|uniref:Uncharacterized protein n=1 Tax=Piedraia hortae CBS 480.64 TaxID=1314780 RepID=A0A6A7C448_9PEZI|nr:hypothetical protein K470DRAFT_256586 [Piedraia hortae CBS 480.64]
MVSKEIPWYASWVICNRNARAIRVLIFTTQLQPHADRRVASNGPGELFYKHVSMGLEELDLRRGGQMLEWCISIDGERVPFEPFQAEVLQGLATVLGSRRDLFEFDGVGV